MGVRFHYLKGSSAEKERLARIQSGKPGSPCTEKHLSFNTEFTEQPICTASRQYQKLKIKQLKSLVLPEEDYQAQLQKVLEKECLCVGLSNASAIKYSTEFVKGQHAVNICPGPNIAWFNKEVSLQEMTDHIYGRASILDNNNRPHMFLAELHLYLDYITEQLEEGNNRDKLKYYNSFCNNISEGINYYRRLAEEAVITAPAFLTGLNEHTLRLEQIKERILWYRGNY
jgi:hypothetical protein